MHGLAAIGTIVAAVMALGGAPVMAGEAVRSWELDSATTVVLVEDHRVPLVTLRIELPAGSWSPWARENHAADAWRLQLYDTAGELRRRADALAVDIHLGSGSRASILTVSSLSEDLDQAVALVRDIFANRDFSRAVLKLWNRSRRLNWSANEKDPRFRGEQELATIFLDTDDPRTDAWRELEKTPADIPRLADTRDAMLRQPGRVVALAGDIDEARARRITEGLLPAAGSAPPGLAPELLPLLPAAREAADRDVGIPRLTQVYFGLARGSLSYTDADYPAFLIADKVLAGHFYSRLYVALRHESGETYGVTSRSYGELAPSFYAVVTFTNAANAGQTERKLREEVARLHDGGIREEERAAACGNLLGREAFRHQAPDQILGIWLWERRLGQEPGFWNGLAELACDLSLEEVNRFIREFYDPEAMVMVRVGPER